MVPTTPAIGNNSARASIDAVAAAQSGRTAHAKHRSRNAVLPDAYRRAWLGRNLSNWVPAILATLGSRRPSRFTAMWQWFNRLSCEGLDNIPAQGPFILALNHIKGPGSVVTLIGAALAAVSQRRPDALDQVQAIVGFREPRTPRKAPGRLLGAAWQWIKGRWSANLLHIPMARGGHSASGLLQWRKSAAQRPTVVFVEGIARPLLGPVRERSGEWLSSLSAPTLPVGIWWQDGRWQVRIGEPIRWSGRRELRDVQLGYRMAQLLPEPLVDPHWRELLARAERLRGSADNRDNQ